MDFQGNLVALLVIEGDGEICFVSESAEAITGYPSGEIKENFFSNILLPEDAIILRDALRYPQPSAITVSMTTKKGSIITASMTITPAFPEECGQHQVAFYSIESVSERWLAEILKHSEDAIIKKDLNGIITDWNPAATRLFEYTPDEAIGRHISLIIPEDRLHEEDMIINSIREGRSIMHFKTERRSRSGAIRYVSLTITPIRSPKGTVIGASKIAHDIASEREVSAYQSCLAAIVSSSDDAIISKTLDGIITTWNKSAEHMFGYTEAEAIGQHISMIIPPDRLSEEDMIIRSIRSGTRIDHFETVRLAKDGRLVNISLTVSPMKDESGKIIGASKIARDIDYKVQADAQKAIYIRRLQELNQYKDDFMVMASHELKTPLTVILANLQILQRVMRDKENMPLLSKTIDKAFQMSNLISNLLDVSKIQVGKLELKKSRYDFYEQLTEVIANLQATTQKHKINLVSESDGHVEIEADKERMQHVLINLIENAIKYSPHGGAVDIRFAQKESWIQLSVSDSGVGIHPDDLENIFQRFYRGRIASSFSGSGVGLFISHEIVKNHGGEMQVESEEAKGTTFYLKLPK